MIERNRASKRNPRSDDAEAFVVDARTVADADSFGEEYIQSCTTGEMAYDDARGELSDEEDGGLVVDERDEAEEAEVEDETEVRPSGK